MYVETYSPSLFPLHFVALRFYSYFILFGLFFLFLVFPLQFVDAQNTHKQVMTQSLNEKNILSDLHSMYITMLLCSTSKMLILD